MVPILHNSKWGDANEPPTTQTLSQIGCDSLDVILITQEIEVVLGRELTSEETKKFGKHSTIDSIMDYLVSLPLPDSSV